MIEKNRKDPVSAGRYATVADFKRIFTEDVNRLYLLSLLLTGDTENAEKCFVEGIGESTKGNLVFKEWARSWARRTIVQSAIRLTSPLKWSATATRSEDVVEVVDKVPVALHAEVCAILDLAPLTDLFSSCLCSNATLTTIVRFSLGAHGVRSLRRELEPSSDW